MEWIKLTEQMPPNLKPVLVYDDNNGGVIYYLYYTKEFNHWTWFDKGFDILDDSSCEYFTHWAEILLRKRNKVLIKN